MTEPLQESEGNWGMANVLLLAVIVNLLGVWMHGSAILYELLCQHIFREAPTGGAAAVLETLVYGSTYCPVLAVLWFLLAQKPF
jgi:hypothetical protein